MHKEEDMQETINSYSIVKLIEFEETVGGNSRQHLHEDGNKVLNKDFCTSTNFLHFKALNMYA